MFNPKFGAEPGLWEHLCSPYEGRPIPMGAYDRGHVLYAVRHPNKGLTICNGDCLFTSPVPKWSVAE